MPHAAPSIVRAVAFLGRIRPAPATPLINLSAITGNNHFQFQHHHRTTTTILLFIIKCLGLPARRQLFAEIRHALLGLFRCLRAWLFSHSPRSQACRTCRKKKLVSYLVSSRVHFVLLTIAPTEMRCSETALWTVRQTLEGHHIRASARGICVCLPSLACSHNLLSFSRSIGIPKSLSAPMIRSRGLLSQTLLIQARRLDNWKNR